MSSRLRFPALVRAGTGVGGHDDRFLIPRFTWLHRPKVYGKAVCNWVSTVYKDQLGGAFGATIMGCEGPSLGPESPWLLPVQLRTVLWIDIQFINTFHASANPDGDGFFGFDRLG